MRALDEWRRAEAIFLYVSVRGEPDTRALIREALEAGRLVAVPRCLEGGAMEAVESSGTAGRGMSETEGSSRRRSKSAH